MSLLVIIASCSAETGFQADDLPRIALQPSDAPEGTRYWSKTSGPQDFKTFAGHEQAQRDLRAAGWEAGFVAIFVEQGFDLDDQETAPKDAVFVAALLCTYKADEAASRSLQAHYVDLREEDASVIFLTAPGLGDEARGARGIWSPSEGGQPWLVYTWRISNLAVHLSIQGELTPKEALNLARKMESRASKLL